jgi:small subunit ribosomal protein S9
MEQIIAVGRRKAAVARVYVRKGEGKITVNGKDYREYFTASHITGIPADALATADVATAYDVLVNVSGGGFKGQAEAVRMGIARALVQINEEFRKPLKVKKYLTRDPRAVERKKYGRPKARARFQFSKR